MDDKIIMEKDNKWAMFRNFMYNELGITKDDIRTWIKEAAYEEAERLTKQAYGKFDINSEFNRILCREINNNWQFKDSLAKAIANNLTVDYGKK